MVVTLDNLTVVLELNVPDLEGILAASVHELAAVVSVVTNVRAECPFLGDPLVRGDLAGLPGLLFAECDRGVVQTKSLDNLEALVNDTEDEICPVLLGILSPADFTDSDGPREHLVLEIVVAPDVLTPEVALDTNDVWMVLLLDTSGWVVVVAHPKVRKAADVLVLLANWELSVVKVESAVRGHDDIVASPGSSLATPSSSP